MKEEQNFRKMWLSHKNYLANKTAEVTTIGIDDIIASLFCPGPFYYYILDSPTLTFDYNSANTEKVLGLNLQNEPVETFLNRIHPDDLPYVYKCEDFVSSFLKKEISPSQITKYKISYSFRQKTAGENYKLFLMQNITLATTIDGALLKVLGVHTDISHITKTNNYKISFIGLNGEPSYMGIDIFKNNDIRSENPHNLFSKREIEVLFLLAEGFAAKEIASKLFVSLDTIITHKKNAMYKSNCSNTTQLVSYCIRNGLI